MSGSIARLYTTLTLAVATYYRARIVPHIRPVILRILPTSIAARLSNYTPLSGLSFADQAAAGISSRTFDLEESNIAEGSGEARLGLDEAGVEDVRRIM